MSLEDVGLVEHRLRSRRAAAREREDGGGKTEFDKGQSSLERGPFQDLSKTDSLVVGVRHGRVESRNGLHDLPVRPVPARRVDVAGRRVVVVHAFHPAFVARLLVFVVAVTTREELGGRRMNRVRGCKGGCREESESD